MLRAAFATLLFLCADVCAVLAVGLAQLLPSLLPHPFLTLWVGGLLRASLLLLLLAYLPGCPQWLRCPEGRQTLGVHCFLSPAYITLLWILGLPTLELFWGWHSWLGIVQGYLLTAVSLLLWQRRIPSLSTKKTKEPEKKISPLSRLLGCIRPYAVRFSAVIVFVVVSSLGEMAIPHYTGKMTDWIQNENDPDVFTHVITVMSLITIMSAVCEFICDLIYNITMSRVHTSVQGLVFQSVLKQEIAFFDSMQTGDIVSRITTDTNATSESLSETLSLLMWYFMRMVFLLFFMFRLSWKLSCFTLLGLAVITVVPGLFGSLHQSMSAQVQESLARASIVATETFSSMKTVRSFANEDGETRRYEQRQEETYALNKKEAAAYAVSTWTNSLASFALKVSILYYGGRLVTGGDVSSGDLVSYVMYELQFSSCIKALMSYFPNVMKAIGQSETIFEYVDRAPQVPPDGSLHPEDLEGVLEFRGVTFAYPTRPEKDVLKDFSLELRPGEVTALVGPPGAGKSTCVSLLERFYQPQEGEILLDGRPLRSYQDHYLHGKIAVVSQEPVLFALSVKENIKYGKENATDDDVYRAATMANADQFIRDLPDGYSTDVGEKGGQISGGQKQRIAIARALIGQPKILVLDDATSSLDSENEHLVRQALVNSSSPCAILWITHRLSAVETANRIVFLKDGEVLEAGSHADLTEKGGDYAQLVQKQNTAFQRNAEREADEEHAECNDEREVDEEHAECNDEREVDEEHAECNDEREVDEEHAECNDEREADEEHAECNDEREVDEEHAECNDEREADEEHAECNDEREADEEHAECNDEREADEEHAECNDEREADEEHAE